MGAEVNFGADFLTMKKTLLFIVGRPRSGTKLLRNILNVHSEIHIAEAESHFIPHFIARNVNSEEYLQVLENSVYYKNLRKRGVEFDLEECFQDPGDIALIIQKLLSYGQTDIFKKNKVIGDKTPNYLAAVDQLKEAFPYAKFLHIIRDPRDQALSAKKVWNQNVMLSAEKWRNEVIAARKVFGSQSERYLEIKYEELLENSAKTLKKIAVFLGVTANFKLEGQFRNDERHGDAKESKGISTQNFGKFQEGLSKKVIRRIEEIAKPTMVKLNYSLLNRNATYRQLTAFEKLVSKAETAFSSYRFHIKEKGLLRGLRYIFQMKGDRRRRG